MAMSPQPEENLVPPFMGSIINTCSNAIEVAKWPTLSCRRPQAATNYVVRDGRSNWQAVSRTIYRAVPLERHLHLRIGAASAGLRGNHFADAAPQGKNVRLNVKLKEVKCSRNNEIIKAYLKLDPIFDRVRYSPKQWMNYPNVHQ